MSGKTLVAYFSHKGMNYTNKGIVELKEGNTAVLAKITARLCNGGLFEIKTVNDYPFDYSECVKVARAELRDNSRPKLAEKTDISDYDTVIIGYPNWYGTIPAAIMSFLEDNSFIGKKILPMCTNEGSGMGRSETDIRKLAKGADIAEGLSVRGSLVNESAEATAKWLRKNGIIG